MLFPTNTFIPVGSRRVGTTPNMVVRNSGRGTAFTSEPINPWRRPPPRAPVGPALDPNTGLFAGIRPPQVILQRQAPLPTETDPWANYKPMTSDEILAAAKAQADAEMAASRQQYLDQINREQQQAAWRGQQIAGLSSALAGILSGIAPQIAGFYGTAAERQASFGKGYEGDLNQALGQQADVSSNLLSNVAGAPSEQVAQANATLGTSAGNVLYGLGGDIPASTLNQQGAGFAAAAAMQPATAVGRGQQDIAGMMGQSAQNIQALDDKIRELIGAEPARISELQGTLSDRQRQEQLLGLQAHNAYVSQLQNTRNYNLSVLSGNRGAWNTWYTQTMGQLQQQFKNQMDVLDGQQRQATAALAASLASQKFGWQKAVDQRTFQQAQQRINQERTRLRIQMTAEAAKLTAALNQGIADAVTGPAAAASGQPVPASTAGLSPASIAAGQRSKARARATLVGQRNRAVDSARKAMGAYIDKALKPPKTTKGDKNLFAGQRGQGGGATAWKRPTYTDLVNQLVADHQELAQYGVDVRKIVDQLLRSRGLSPLGEVPVPG